MFSNHLVSLVKLNPDSKQDFSEQVTLTGFAVEESFCCDTAEQSDMDTEIFLFLIKPARIITMHKDGNHCQSA